MGRLIQVKKDGVIVEAYTYDKNGNRASATINNETTNGYYTLDDQIVTYGNNTYQYNDDGYLQSKVTPNGTTTYQYGAFGELQRVVTPTKTIEYLHNANNQRVAKKVDGVIVEKYLWANLTTLLAIYDKDDNLVQRFEYADQRMPIAMMQNNQKYYLHYDQVGSLRAVSDTTGTIIKEVVYDTFGNILTDSNEAFRVPFGFAGGLYDNDTKLTRFGYRDYDAYTGKWTAKDPIGFSGGDSNLYGYVLGDPVNLIDPKGLCDDPLFGVDQEIMEPLYEYLEELFGDKPPSGAEKIAKGLYRDVPLAVQGLSRGLSRLSHLDRSKMKPLERGMYDYLYLGATTNMNTAETINIMDKVNTYNIINELGDGKQK